MGKSWNQNTDKYGKFRKDREEREKRRKKGKVKKLLPSGTDIPTIGQVE
jgi:hypothetical protein